MAFVVDASATLSWCFRDERTPATVALLRRAQGGESLLVPAHWAVEVLNVLLMGHRRGRLNAVEMDDRLVDLGSLDIAEDRLSLNLFLPEVLRISQQHRLTAYDAAYLELALRRRLPLATLDKDLASAARAEAVPLLL